MTVPTASQEYTFLAALQSAEAVRQVARAQALASFDPTDPTHFASYVAATAAANAVFRASVVAAAAAANITLAPPGSSP
jgi:hypothetical protein